MLWSRTKAKSHELFICPPQDVRRCLEAPDMRKLPGGPHSTVTPRRFGFSNFEVGLRLSFLLLVLVLGLLTIAQTDSCPRTPGVQALPIVFSTGIDQVAGCPRETSARSAMDSKLVAAC